MNTECKPKQLELHRLGSRQVVSRFDGGRISSDGGGVLLRELEQRTHILKRLADCFVDYRNRNLIEHSVQSQPGQAARSGPKSAIATKARPANKAEAAISPDLALAGSSHGCNPG